MGVISVRRLFPPNKTPNNPNSRLHFVQEDRAVGAEPTAVRMGTAGPKHPEEGRTVHRICQIDYACVAFAKHSAVRRDRQNRH